jgi:hypothetical protein
MCFQFVEDLSPNVTHIIKLNIEEEEQLLERLGILESLHAIKIWTEERLVHKLSGRSYHPKFNPSQAELKDDVGRALVQDLMVIGDGRNIDSNESRFQ